jgi:hypothetical protein
MSQINYNTFLESAREFLGSDLELESFMSFINQTKILKKVDFILILQSNNGHPLIEKIKEYIEFVNILDKNIMISNDFCLQIFNLDQEFDHNTVKILEKIFKENLSNFILVTENFDISLPKNGWLNDIKYKLFEIDFCISEDFNYSEFYREKAILVRPKIINEFCQNVIKKIIESMSFYSKKGIMQFDIQIMVDIYKLYNSKEECEKDIIKNIKYDKKLESNYFDVTISASRLLSVNNLEINLNIKY